MMMMYINIETCSTATRNIYCVFVGQI